MDLSKAFNSTDIATSKATPFALDAQYSTRGGSLYMTYDFLSRVLVMRSGSSDGGLTVMPFAQIDRETLVAARDRLVTLGGSPPELPAEAPTIAPRPRGLNP